MNRKRLAGVLSSVSGIILISTFCGWSAEGPTIPPTVDRIWPVGMKRGKDMRGLHGTAAKSLLYEGEPGA